MFSPPCSGWQTSLFSSHCTVLCLYVSCLAAQGPRSNFDIGRGGGTISYSILGGRGHKTLFLTKSLKFSKYWGGGHVPPLPPHPLLRGPCSRRSSLSSSLTAVIPKIFQSYHSNRTADRLSSANIILLAYSPCDNVVSFYLESFWLNGLLVH